MVIQRPDQTANGIKTQLKNNPTTRKKVIKGLSKTHTNELKSAVEKGGAPASEVHSPSGRR